MSGTKSILENVEIPEAPVSVSTVAKEPSKPLSRYMRNKAEHERLAKVMAERKAAKAKTPRKSSKPDGKLSKRAHKVAERTAAVKQILSKKQEPEKGGGSLYGACSFCGKPLTRPSSVAQGMGDFCAHNKGALPGGVTREEHIISLTVTELPKDYVKLGDAYWAARKAGYSGSRFMQACGGNGGIRPPLNEHFKMIFFKAKRYVPASALKHFKDLEKK